jgi:hypothetical protein
MSGTLHFTPKPHSNFTPYKQPCARKSSKGYALTSPHSAINAKVNWPFEIHPHE